MKEKFIFNISKETQLEALKKGLRKGSREQELEGGGKIKCGAHKNKKKYSRKEKHKKA